MKTTIYYNRVLACLLLLATLIPFSSNSQFCDSIVPTTIVDLSASPNMNWVSAPIVRDGSCCGVTNPDRCLEFVITLHPNAIAVSFNIASGAIPPGALFYQIDCGPPTPVGSPICLTGPGPHHLTFCKPGNNANTFSITSYSEPIIGPDITLNAGCQGFIYGNYYNEPSMTWTSIAPGSPGAYDNLLSCTSGCDTTYVTAPANPPSFVDYVVCGMDIGGCNPLPYCDTIRVNFIPPVQVSVNSSVTGLCPGETTVITSDVQGGTPPYNYLWSTSSTQTSIIAGPGTYYVDVTDQSGCIIASDTITITQYAIPLVYAGPDQEVCEGESVTLTASGGINFFWSGGVLDNVPFVPVLGTHTYSVQGENTFGCTNGDIVQVTVHAQPAVDAGEDIEMCEGPLVLFYESPTIYWNNGVVNGIQFYPPVGQNEYILTDSLQTGCMDKDTVLVTVFPKPVVTAEDVTICEGESVILSGQGANFYDWSGGITNNQEFYPQQSELYTVIGSDINGCKDTATAMVNVNPSPTASFDIDNYDPSTSNPIINFTNFSSNASSFIWDFGDGSIYDYSYEPTHTYPDDESGTYVIQLTAISPEGCEDIETRVIDVKQDYSIYVPNAFTPDNNGVNEIFTPVLRGFDEQDYTMLIFNRWGEIVFESNNMEVGWDGSYAHKFEQAQDGVYIWKINARVKNTSETKEFTGHVTLLK
jgi:gliding motility-associated-like protein